MLFSLSGRRTYIDALIYPFLPKESKAGYYFYDLNAKLNYVINDKDRLYVSGYFGKDKFYANFKDDYSDNKANFNWGNATATARWNHLFNNKLFMNTSFIFTDYKLGISSEYKDDFNNFSLRYTSGIRDYSIKSSFDYIPNPEHYIKFGLQSIYHQFRPGATVIKSSFSAENYAKTQLIEAFENAVFIEDDWKITKKWRVNAGLRLTNFIVQDQNYFNPEPRMSWRYLIKEDLSIKASYALMNQYMHLLSNTGIGLPTDLWVPATKRHASCNRNKLLWAYLKISLKRDTTYQLKATIKK